MSTAHLIQTIIEGVLVIALFVCLIYEPAIAMWEKKQKRKVLRALKERKKFRGENQNV